MVVFTKLPMVDSLYTVQISHAVSLELRTYESIFFNYRYEEMTKFSYF